MKLPPPLVAHVQAIAPLREDTWAALAPRFRRVVLDRGAHFAPPGRPARRFGLLETGWIRAYHTTAGGAEYNKHLFHGPAVVGDYASLLTGGPVRIPQQALTPCVVFAADYAGLVALFEPHRDLERFARRFAERLYLEKEQRELELVTLTAAERYRRLRERHPTIEADLPQYAIASHLGVTPTQLSRIRSARRGR
jgi:CRP-like cAMP-binding protein